MSEHLTFTLPGPPMAQKRHRDRRGGLGKYDPSKRDKQMVRQVAMLSAGACRGLPYTGPVVVRLLFSMPIPKQHRVSAWARIRASNILAKLWPTAKPDIDNMEKLITDALIGIAYKDDAQVVAVLKAKAYMQEGCPETVVSVRPATALDYNWLVASLMGPKAIWGGPPKELLAAADRSQT